MAHLSQCLLSLMARHNLSQTDVADRAKVALSVVNRSVRGQSELSDENFEAIVKAITADEDEQAECVCARLKDWCSGPSSNRVEIRVRYERMKDAQRFVVRDMYQRAMDHLDALSNKDPDVREMMIDIARVLGAELGRNTTDPRKARE